MDVHFLSTEGLGAHRSLRQSSTCHPKRIGCHPLPDDSPNERGSKKNPLDKRYIVRGLMSAIIPYIKREYDLQQQKKKRNKDTEKLSYLDTRIQNALNILLSKTSDSDISIAELASMCNTSVSNFRAVFHEQVGMSPKKFQIELKLKKAMSLIRFSQLRIMDISYECGFNSISNFNRQFFSRYGISPSQVRKNKY